MIDKDEWIHFNKMNIWPWQSDERTVWSMPCFGRILSVSNIDSVWHGAGHPSRRSQWVTVGPWKCHPVSQIQPFSHPKNGRNKPTWLDKEPVKSPSLLSITWHSVVLKEWTVPTCSQGRSRTPSPNFGDNLVGNSFQGRRAAIQFYLETRKSVSWRVL